VLSSRSPGALSWRKIEDGLASKPRPPVAVRGRRIRPKGGAMFQGLRTVIYRAHDLDAAKAWYASVLGRQPYFAEPFYVGFNVGGFELGLDPDARDVAQGAGPVTYWGVENVDAALARLLELGASAHRAVQDVGGGIRVASVLDPFGNVVGVIENPHFKLAG
jgi:predicted enzyme related to lactoylglutathione lyase